MIRIINIFLKLFGLELNDIKDTPYKPYDMNDIDIDRYIAILTYENEIYEDDNNLDVNITAIQESLNYVNNNSNNKQLEVMQYFNKLNLQLKNDYSYV